MSRPIMPGRSERPVHDRNGKGAKQVGVDALDSGNGFDVTLEVFDVVPLNLGLFVNFGIENVQNCLKSDQRRGSAIARLTEAELQDENGK